MAIALHVTHKNKVDSIKRNGLICKTYPNHPIAKSCSVFFYPINGADRSIKFRPQNAKFRNEDLDDEHYIIADIDNGTVGDLDLESWPNRYIENTMEYSKYYKECMWRNRFREPEIVIKGNILKDRIVGSLPYTKLKEIYDKCYDKNERIHKCDCVENDIKKIIRR